MGISMALGLSPFVTVFWVAVALFGVLGFLKLACWLTIKES